MKMRYFSSKRAFSILTCVSLTVLAATLAPAAQADPKGVKAFFGNPVGVGNSIRAAEFGSNSPLGVAVNSNPGLPNYGDIYVADASNNRIQRFSSLGQFELMWGRNVIKPLAEVNTDLGDVYEICTYATDCKNGSIGALGGELTVPRAVAVDQVSGNVYVVERGAGSGTRVQAFSPDGEFIWAAGDDVIADGSASDPTGIATAQVCTVAIHCKAATAGGGGGEFGDDGSIGGSEGGNGVAVVPTGPLTTTPPFNNGGNVVVTDRGNRRVQELAPGGGFVRAFGWDVVTDGSPSDPTSVGTFQICTVAADCKQGATTGDEAGRFATNTPNRVAVDSTGAIYTVENSANFRLQKFTPQAGPPALAPAIVNPDVGGSGPALPLTGTATLAPDPVTSASENTPLAVAVGPSDHLFVVKAYPAGIGTPAATVAERRVVELDSAGSLVDTHGARAGISSVLYLAARMDSEDVYMSAMSSPAGGGTGVYVLGELAPPTASLGIGPVSSHTAELDGLIDPGGPGTAIGIRTRYHFEYRKVGAPTWTAVSSDKDAGNGFASVSVAATLDELEADTDYEARLLASRPFSGMPSVETAPEAFRTPPSRPDIDAAYATERAATTTKLNARINPNGVATSFRFEYGTTAAYGSVVPVPDGSAGAGSSSQIFSEALTGLAPETTYHFRVTATSANGVTKSADRTFTTRAAAQPPIGRAYELVSPADKIGGSGVGPWYAGVGSHGNTGIPSHVGDRYASLSYYGASLIDGKFSYGSDWTFAERTPDGWVNRPAFSRPGGFGTAEFAKVVRMDGASDDLSLTSWTGGGSQISIFPEQPATFGSALGSTGGSALREWNSGRWEIVAPWALGQQAGTVFGMTSKVAADGGYALVAGGFRGVAGAGDPTSPGFTGGPADLVCPTLDNCNGNLYVDDVTAGLSDSFPGAGVRSLVNICTGAGPSRTAIPSVDSGGKLVAAECPAALPGRSARLISPRGASVAAEGSAPGHMSNDGSRIFFVSPDHVFAANRAACSGIGPVSTSCPPQVYVRQRNGDGTVTTRWISRSVVDGQDASLTAPAIFEGATPDGDKAFFRTASPLTPDDPNGGAQVPGGVRTGTASSSSVDLYMYDFPDAPGADPGDGTLTRVSAGPTGAGDANVSTDAADSTTSALRALGDGGRAYFVTAARLPGVAPPTDGTITLPSGTPSQTAVKNLYVFDAALSVERRWRFVAQLPATTTLGDCAATGSLVTKETLQAGSNGTGLNGEVRRDGGAGCVRASADGSFVAFFTDGRLTADDPDGAATGDIYAYDSVSDELTRLSAPQGGASGGSYVCVTEGAGVGTLCHGDPRISGLGSRRRLLSAVVGAGGSGDRTAFFESVGRLVPEDQNDVYDVYQWRDGELSLLSTGVAGAEPALYQGNDRAARNVYISTRDRLVPWQDHDVVLDVYAARVDGGIPEPAAPPTCALLADACQGGGAGAVRPTTPATSAPSDGNADGTTRKTLSVASPSRRVRRAATRSGVLRLAVRLGGGGEVTAVAKARIGKRSLEVTRKTVRVGAGTTTLRLRLNRAARRRLADGDSLRVTLRISAADARTRSMTVRLPGAKP